LKRAVFGLFFMPFCLCRAYFMLIKASDSISVVIYSNLL
jgi:hypothetical protein